QGAVAPLPARDEAHPLPRRQGPEAVHVARGEAARAREGLGRRVARLVSERQTGAALARTGRRSRAGCEAPDSDSKLGPRVWVWHPSIEGHQTSESMVRPHSEAGHAYPQCRTARLSGRTWAVDDVLQSGRDLYTVFLVDRKEYIRKRRGRSEGDLATELLEVARRTNES